MKKLIALILLLFTCPVFAAESLPQNPRDSQDVHVDPSAGVLPIESYHSLKDEAFVVETSEEDAAGSLDRISGKIDLGFSSKDGTYRSENHYKAGPFGKSKAMDKLLKEDQSSQKY
mgnify:CR=1 FL=1